MIAAAAVIVLLAAGTGVGIWLTRSHHPAGQTSAGGSGPGQQLAAGTPSAVSQSPAPSASSSPVTPTASPSVATPSPSATAPGNTVTVSPAAAADPQSQSVAAFLEQYFTAINAHDFEGYRDLLGPRLHAAMTRGQFNRGYRSTVDSGEKLRSISSDASGDTVATVTFTSHQNPADSVNGRQSCTRWRISLFLQPTAGGYVIEQAPPGYHSSYSACR